MNIGLLYLLLLKGTITAFAGLASLPVIQESLVNHYHVLTNEELNEAVVITRSSPGPVGLYIVSVGYFAAGLLLTTKIDTLWMVLGAALVSWTVSSIGLIAWL
jgi:chromate transport protein ChrA